MLEQIYLGRRIDFNVQIVDLGLIAIIHLNVELSGVLEDEIVDDGVTTSVEMHHVRASAFVRQVLFVVEKAEDPPMVTSPIDLTTSADCQVIAVVER